MITISITELSLDQNLYSFELVCQHNNLQVMFKLYKILKDKIKAINNAQTQLGYEIEIFGQKSIKSLILIDKEAMYEITAYITNLINEVNMDVDLNIVSSKLRTIYTVNVV